MGLNSIIRKLKEKENNLRLLILGLDNAGKTSIIKKLNGEDIDSISPTLGFNIQTLTFEEYQLNLWDVGGQVTLRAFWSNYFEDTDAIIFVIDSSDKDRLLDCKKELSKLLQEEKLAGSPVLIFCNKRDLKNSLSDKEIFQILGFEEMMVNRHYMLLGCSASTGDGLLHGIQWIISEIKLIQ